MLKTVGANKDAPVPIRLFEASDVVLPTPDSATGSSNVRRLGAVHVARESGFEIIHGLLNRLMDKLGLAVAGGGVLQHSCRHRCCPLIAPCGSMMQAWGMPCLKSQSPKAITACMMLQGLPMEGRRVAR